MRRFLAVLALLVVAACGSIGVQAHAISLAYKKGDTYKYKFHVVLKYTIGAQGMSLPFDLDISANDTMTVNSVDSSGTADMSVTLSNMSMKMTMNGTTNTTTTTTATTVDVKIASDGRIVSVNGNATSMGSLPGLSGSEGGVMSAILPDGTVKPGDTWTKNYDETGVMGAGNKIHVTTTNKYVADEKVGSTDTAKVQSNIKATLDITIDMSSMLGGAGAQGPPTGANSGLSGISLKGTESYDVTSWIDSSAHRVVKTHGTGTLDATMNVNATGGPSTSPMLTGPITFKGTETVDMNPA